MKAIAGTTAQGMNLVGGTTSGSALLGTNTSGNAASFTASGGNGHALLLAGNGTGAGVQATGGATGNGAKFTGGSTSGDAILTAVTSGTGLTATLSALASTYTELSSCPAATASLPDMLRYLYMLARNKLVQTSAGMTVYKDDGISSFCATATTNVSGTFTRNELN